MNAPSPPSAQLLRAARRRIWLDCGALALPAVLLAAAAGWRASGAVGLIAAALAAALAASALTWRRLRRHDARRLAARLDARAPELEDSAELLFQPAGALHGLAALQRRRLDARLEQGLPLDPKPPWSRRAIAASWLTGLIGTAALLALGLLPGPATRGAAQAGASIAAVPQITAWRLMILPPAYTGLRPRQQSQPAVKAPAGARVDWSLQVSAAPASVRITFADGGSIPLRRAENRWIASRVAERSTLYRIEIAGAPQQAWHRLEVIADAPPSVAVVSPQQRLSIAEPGQTQWAPVFEASDDYGLDPIADLRVTLASGDGEQISVVRREMPVRGSGSGRRQRWTIPLDLAREGLAPGGDLIVQLIVRDNRRPTAQAIEGPSVILRQLTEAELAEGLDSLQIPNIPAFFRSQRQIIIDAEALVKQRRRLSPEVFTERANALGADQAALRFRYGQFVGEDAGQTARPIPGTPATPPPTSDAPPAETQEHFAGDGHDHGEAAGAEDQEQVTARSAARQFGHVHDEGDAANLFSRDTRSALTRALDAMWGSERELRQSRPEAALPFARQALEALKLAQGASRVYLKRNSSRLAPLDLARRLTGKRAGIEPARPIATADLGDQTAAIEAWRALEQRPGAPPLQLAALEAWAVANAEARPDPLALIAAIAAVQLDPECADCRQELRATLWAALQASPTAQRRAGADPQGRLYLEALE